MSHYFSPEQKTPLDLQAFNIAIGGKEYSFFSGSGVFSKGHFDTGSLVLVNHMKVIDGQRVLDLGCGVGVVGITVKVLYPQTMLFFSDVNERAVKLTKMNLKRYKLDGEVVLSDGFIDFPDEHFDVILLNPPFHAGKKKCFSLIDGAYAHLVAGGSLQIVARHKKGGASYSAYMESVFGNIGVLGRQSGFRVYISYK